MNQGFPEGKILFRFSTNPEDDITGVDDMAVEYVVVECHQAMAGVVIYGKNSVGEWIVNWSARHVVKRLLEEKTRLERRLL